VNEALVQGLIECLPGLASRRGRRVVVKLGGSAMEAPAALEATIQDLVVMQALGQKLVVVHGGGKAIDRALDQAGIEPKKIAGRRVTDEKTLETVVRVLGGQITPNIVSRIEKYHGRAKSSADILKCVRIVGELGFVGQVTEVKVEAIEENANQDFMMVLPSLGWSANGNCLNINADDAATAVAAHWKARDLIFITDAPGILRQAHDPSSVIRRITPGAANELIADGVITGGMIPKVEGCLAALDQGVNRVLILDGRVHHALLWESLSGECIGTEFVK
jgi:acetylglutamate kinase